MIPFSTTDAAGMGCRAGLCTGLSANVLSSAPASKKAETWVIVGYQEQEDSWIIGAASLRLEHGCCGGQEAAALHPGESERLGYNLDEGLTV